MALHFRNISADLFYLALSSPILRSHISKMLDCHSGTMPLFSHLFSSFWPYFHSFYVIIFFSLPMSVAVEGVSSKELFSWLMVASAAAFEASLSPFGNMVLPSIAILDGSNLSRWLITSSKILTYVNLVRNHPRIHRNPPQFIWCSFNLNFNLTHSRYFRHNNLV